MNYSHYICCIYALVAYYGFFLGVPHLREDEVPPAGGKPGWAAPPNVRMGPWLRLLKSIAKSHNLTPEFEVYIGMNHLDCLKSELNDLLISVCSERYEFYYLSSI